MDSLPPRDIAGLVQPGRVHRAASIDPVIFEQEMRLIFGRAWVYLCHDSQVATPGSFFTTVMGREPVIVSRDRGGVLHVLFNRCTHRGAKLATDETGSAKRFVCCYHGWPSNWMASSPRCRCRKAMAACRAPTARSTWCACRASRSIAASSSRASRRRGLRLPTGSARSRVPSTTWCIVHRAGCSRWQAASRDMPMTATGSW